MGQLSFHSYLLYILINSDATYSFIAQGIIEMLWLKSTFMFDISIEMLDGDK